MSRSPFNFVPVKDGPQIRTRALSADANWSKQRPVNSSVIGVDPRAVRQPRNKTGGLTTVPTHDVVLEDLVENSALGKAGADFERSFGKWTGRAPTPAMLAQRLRENAAKEQAEKTAAIPDPQFYERPDLEFSRGRRPRYPVNSILGIPECWQPIGFAKASAAATAMLTEASGQGRVEFHPVNQDQSPTGDLEDQRVANEKSFGMGTALIYDKI